jgi:DNA mismatch repair protein MutH
MKKNLQRKEGKRKIGVNILRQKKKEETESVKRGIEIEIEEIVIGTIEEIETDIEGVEVMIEIEQKDIDLDHLIESKTTFLFVYMYIFF